MNRKNDTQLVTKEDLKKLATKADLKVFRGEFKRTEKSLRGEILRVEERVENLEDGQKRLEKKMDHVQGTLDAKLDKLQNTLDGFVGTVDELRTENEVGAHQAKELEERVNDHEKRITELQQRI